MAAIPKRRWYQFSLKTLLVLMLLVSVALGWLGTLIRRGREQHQAVEAIQLLGVYVSYPEPSTYFQRSKWLNAWLGTDTLLSPNSVNAANLTMGDAEAVHLKRLTKLERMWICRTQIGDAGLVNLKGMTQLQQLQLSDTPVSDVGLVHLKDLTQLQWLFLDGTQVGDAGLVHLKGLTNLMELNLSNTSVSDAGLVHLKGLAQLQALHLSSTQVSEKGISELKKVLPNLQVD